MGVRPQLAPLPAVVVRVEDEPALVGRSQQDVPDRGPGVRVGRRERDGVRELDPRGLGLGEPPEELFGRVVEQVGSVQGPVLVRDLGVHPVGRRHRGRLTASGRR